jgi:hypothetical protein
VLLLVAAVLFARQYFGARSTTYVAPQQDTAVAAPQDVSSGDEADICRGSDSYTYELDGKRYSLPFDVIDDQAIVEGDIVLAQAADVQKEGAATVVPDYIRGEPKRWDNRLVPYIFDESVTESDRATIRQALTAWQQATNVRFRELSGTRNWRTENYVKFSGRKTQCTSNSLGIKEKLSGKANEDDNVNVVEVAGCGQDWGRIAHQVGHVLGLGHEHSRGMRDSYIKVLWRNIDGPKQFCRAIWDQPALANTSYDYDSIMHYAPDRGAKRSSGCEKVTYDGKEDCLAFLPDRERLEQQRQRLRSTVKPGQRDHLSEGDIARVNALYPAASTNAAGPPAARSSATAEACVRTTTTSVRIGDRTTTTTRTESCSPSSPTTITERRVVRPLCCRVRLQRADAWCRSPWCRPRRDCDDGWFEARRQRVPVDDWDGWSYR